MKTFEKILNIARRLVAAWYTIDFIMYLIGWYKPTKFGIAADMLLIAILLFASSITITETKEETE